MTRLIAVLLAIPVAALALAPATILFTATFSPDLPILGVEGRYWFAPTAIMPALFTCGMAGYAGGATIKALWAWGKAR